MSYQLFNICNNLLEFLFFLMMDFQKKEKMRLEKKYVKKKILLR